MNHEPRKVAVDYKGKHFIIFDDDRVESDDIVLHHIAVQYVIENELEEHVQDCLYYGIPPYVGTDDELNKRIDELQANILNK